VGGSAGTVAMLGTEVADCAYTISKMTELNCKSIKGEFKPSAAVGYTGIGIADCLSWMTGPGDMFMDAIISGIQNAIASSSKEVLPVSAAESCCSLVSSNEMGDISEYVNILKDIDRAIRDMF
jgi:hypothetical protein